MTTDTRQIVALILALVYMAWFIRHEVKERKKFWNSLPSLEEAQQMIASDYPDHVDSFKLTKKLILGLPGLYGGWGEPSYKDVLESKELEVSIEVRLGEKY